MGFVCEGLGFVFVKRPVFTQQQLQPSAPPLAARALQCAPRSLPFTHRVFVTLALSVAHNLIMAICNTFCMYGDAAASQKSWNSESPDEVRQTLNPKPQTLNPKPQTQSTNQTPQPPTPNSNYQPPTPTPPQVALVAFADVAGFEFVGEVGGVVTLHVKSPAPWLGCNFAAKPMPASGLPFAFSVKHKLEFSSARKRMSLILLCPDGVYRLLSKVGGVVGVGVSVGFGFWVLLFCIL